MNPAVPDRKFKLNLALESWDRLNIYFLHGIEIFLIILDFLMNSIYSSYNLGIYSLTPKKYVLCIIGDWNAKVGSQEIPGVTGKIYFGIKIKQGKG